MSGRASCAPGSSGAGCTAGWGQECSQPCTGLSCNRLRAKMTNLLDLGADPCDDFYKFACNVAKRGSPVPPAKQDVLSLEQLVKNPPQGFEYVKKFYESCNSVSSSISSSTVLFGCMEDGVCTDSELGIHGKIYVDFVKALKEFVNLTNFPAVTPNWEEVTSDMFGGQGWNWWDFAAEIMKDHFFLGAFQYRKGHETTQGIDVFYSNLFFSPLIDTTVDTESLKEGDLLPMIHIVPMTLTRIQIEVEEREVQMYRYRLLMTTLIKFLGQNKGSAVNETTIEADIDRIIELELQLGKINRNRNFKSNEKYTNEKSNEKWEIMTVQQLSNTVPSVEWKEYIEATMQHNPRFKVHKYTRVKVPSKELMREMGRFIKNIEEKDRRAQANMLIWRMIIMFANNFMHTGISDDDSQYNIFSHEIDPSATTRSGNCLTQLETFFPDVKDDMLIAQYIDKNTKRSIVKMFEGIKIEFETVIEESSWMTKRTKVRAIEKLKETDIKIGELLPNTPEFQELKNNMSSNYMDNVNAIGNYIQKTLSRSIDIDKLISRGYEADINAYYYPVFNFIRVKTGLINGLLGLGFSLHYPPSLLYGGFVAATLGHELTHGFDSNGNKYGKDGYRLDWWEKSDKEAFQERTKCMVSFPSEGLTNLLFRLINTPPSKFRSTD